MVETRFIASKSMWDRPVCTESASRLDAMNRVSTNGLPSLCLSSFPWNYFYIVIPPFFKHIIFITWHILRVELSIY